MAQASPARPRAARYYSPNGLGGAEGPASPYGPATTVYTIWPC